VDGLGYALRRAVLRNADSCGLNLTTKKRAELSEKAYDPSSGTIGDKQKNLSTLDSIKLGVSYFSQLFGKEFKLDTGGEEWRGFDRIVRVRHKFTHPASVEDLHVINAIPALVPTLIWFNGQMQALLAECADAIGQTGATKDVPFHAKGYKESEHPPLEVFKQKDYDLIASDYGRSIEYLGAMLTLAASDVSYGLGLVLRREHPVLSYGWEFSFRNAVRTLFSAVEATTSASTRFVDAAISRGDISSQLPEESGKREVEDKFAASVNLFSRTFGYGNCVPVTGALWSAFRGTRFLRDKLTHPKEVRDLRIDVKTSESIMLALKYFLAAQESLMLK
jgi:hypothetical protein